MHTKPMKYLRDLRAYETYEYYIINNYCQSPGTPKT